MDCRSLFPFEKIPLGAKVLIYGCTSLGMDYWQQLATTKYADCLGFLDRKAEQYKGLPVPVYLPEQAGELEADCIVIALQTPAQWQTVETCLLSVGMEQEQLVYGGFREEMPFLEGTPVPKKNEDAGYAYETGRTAIAVKFNSALGDNVIRKSVVEALARLAPGCAIDIYSPVASSVVRSLYYGCDYIHALIDDGGWLYQSLMKKYDLALRIEILQANVDWLGEGLTKRNPKLHEAMQAYQEHFHGEAADADESTFLNVNRALFLGQNCYTIFDGGVLGIKKMRTNVKLDPSFQERYAALGVGVSYITFGCAAGAGTSAKTGGYKQWPLERWQEFVQGFKEGHPSIKVVQLGAKGVSRLQGTDVYLLGEDLRLVQYVLQGAFCHVDIESGLVHLATQLETRCVVLMGPTQQEFWCYPQNVHVTKGNCSSCCGLYRGDVRCARNMLQPECMMAIEVADVLTAVNKCLAERNGQYV